MTIKSTVTHTPQPSPKSEYPCLKEYRALELVVLFSSPRKGTVVSSKSWFHPIGYQSETWGEFSSTPFHGSVTLSNEE